MSTLAWLLILISGYVGFGLLALAMERHRRTLLPGSRPWMVRTRHLLRLGGVLCLALSLAVCVRILGAAVGIVGWTGVLTVGAMLVMGQISYREARQRKVRVARPGR